MKQCPLIGKVFEPLALQLDEKGRVIARPLSRSEIEDLAEAIVRRMHSALVDTITDLVVQASREVEGTLGAEADRISRQILAKLGKE